MTLQPKNTMMKRNTTFSPAEQDKEAMPLGHCLQQWSRNYGERIALVNDFGESLSYSTLQERVERLAGGLYAAGLRAGDIAIMQLPNTFGFFITFFALMRLGAIPVMTMPNQREQDVDALMQLAHPVAYFIPNNVGGQDFLAMAKILQSRHESLRLIVVDDLSDETSNDVLALDRLQGSECPWPEQGASDTALLLLSGGTTGTPKLIPRTHADYFYNFTASARLCRFDQDTVFLAVLPIAHNFALACPGILGALHCGGQVVTSTLASCDHAMPLIEKERVTHVALVPPLAKLWVEGREWEDSDLSSLKLVQVGGARLEAGLARQLMDVLDCQLQQVFGMAEGLLCYTRLDDPLETILHTQGRPLSADDEVRIVDDEDRDVMQGQIGQLLTRGPYTIRGYFRAPAQNTSSFTEDGFYRSGDLVSRDANGNLTVQGRIKEQINRCGEKISAAEVEYALNALHGVHAAVVIGVSDELVGERVCAFIKPEDQAINPAHIKATLRANGLSDYKVPEQIETIEEWPLTAAGKIDKRRLIAIATQRAAQFSETTLVHYLQAPLAMTDNPLDMAVKLVSLIQREARQYTLYERNGEWTLALDCAMEICVEANGTVRRSDGKFWHCASPVVGIEQALADIPFADWRAYGRADFEFAYLTYGIKNTVHPGPLLKLVIPRCEIRIQTGEVQLRTIDADELAHLKVLVETARQHTLPRCDTPIQLAACPADAGHYQQLVTAAVAEMHDYLYQKVILSRCVDVPVALDMLASYYAGRRCNTPARSFLLQDGSFQAYGFSPEIVVTVDAERNVSTQPLAGTRALTGNQETDQQLRRELLSDVKEIAEHAVSVKLAVEEIRQVCQAGSVHGCLGARQCPASGFAGKRRIGSAHQCLDGLREAVSRRDGIRHPQKGSTAKHPQARRAQAGTVQRLRLDGRQ